MRQFTATEHDRDLDLVSFFKEAKRILELHVEIMLLNVRPQLDLLDRDDLLLLLRLFLPLLLLVTVLAEIHDAADRRLCLRRDLDEIEMLLFRHAQGVARRHDAELLAGRARDAHLANADFFVDS